MEDIDDILNSYDPGRTEHKKDVTKQLANIKVEREKMIQEYVKKEIEYNETMTAIHMLTNPQLLQMRVAELDANAKQLIEKNKFLENKIKTFISEITVEEVKYTEFKQFDNKNPVALKQHITELEIIVNKLASLNKALDNKLKEIIQEKIQEKMKQKAGPTLTLNEST